MMNHDNNFFQVLKTFPLLIVFEIGVNETMFDESIPAAGKPIDINSVESLKNANLITSLPRNTVEQCFYFIHELNSLNILFSFSISSF